MYEAQKLIADYSEIEISSVPLLVPRRYLRSQFRLFYGYTQTHFALI